MTETATPTKRRTLLDISADLVAIDELLFESGGDISDPAVAEAIDAWFAECETSETEKVGNYIGLIREKELRESAIKEEAERLQLLARALGNSAKGLKERLKFYMELVSKKKIETSRGNATVCGNGGKLPLWVDPEIDPANLPARFQKVTLTMSGAVFEKVDTILFGPTAAADLLHQIGTEEITYKFEIDTDVVRAALDAGEQLKWARLEDRGSHLRIR